jgi:hypothetical protein
MTATRNASSLTRHAHTRCSDRGLPLSVASLLIDHGDLMLHAGEGCVSLRLGRDAAAMLIAEGADPDCVARARRLAAVLGDHGVVTVLRPQGRGGRRYRRQFPTRAGREG